MGIAAAKIAAASGADKAGTVTIKIRYGASSALGDPCKDKQPGYNLAWWRTQLPHPDIRLDCEGLSWLRTVRDATNPKWALDCITLIIANGTNKILGPRSSEWNWKGGQVVISEEDRIVHARPVSGQTWEQCAQSR
jgi:hypothetical protein